MVPVRRSICCLLLTAAVCLGGCFFQKDAPEVTRPQAVGIVDMSKALRAHHEWSHLQVLQREINTVKALQQQRLKSAQTAQAPEQLTDAPGDNGLADFIAAGRQAQVNSRRAELQAAAAEQNVATRNRLQQEYQEYADSVEREYQPAIFSIQLKLNTLQLDKPQLEILQQELKQLQADKAAKLSAYSRSLEDRYAAATAPQQAAIAAELAAFDNQLHTAEASQRPTDNEPAAQDVVADNQTDNNDSGAELAEHLQDLQREYEILYGAMTADVSDKAAKIAAESGLDIVLTGIEVNVSAQDITDAVIAELKK